MPLCPECSAIAPDDALFCGVCGHHLQGNLSHRYPVRRWIIGAAIGMLVVTSLTAWFFRDRWNRPAGQIAYNPKVVATNSAGLAAQINGETISIEEFQRQMNEVVASYRHRYGEDVFNDSNGKAALRRVKASLMDDLVNRRLLLKQVRQKGYTSAVTDREIDDEIQRIKSESGLNDRGFAEKLRFAGLTLDRFRQEVGDQLTIDRFIATEVLAGAKNDTERRSRFSRWFSTLKTSANVTIYLPDAAPIPSVAGCGSSGSSCGNGGDCAGSCGSGVTQLIDPGLAAEIKQKALRYYAEHYGKDLVLVNVTNYGCHIQVDILKDGKIAQSFTYSGGEFFEI